MFPKSKTCCPVHYSLNTLRNSPLDITVAMPVCPRSVSCHPMGSISFKALQAQPLPHCHSQEMNLSRETPRPPPPLHAGDHCTTHERTVTTSGSHEQPVTPTGPHSDSAPQHACSPGKKNSKVTAPSPGRRQQGVLQPPSCLSLLAQKTLETFVLSNHIREPNPPTPTTAQEDEEEQVLSPPQPRPQPLGQNKTLNEQTPAAPTATSESVSSPPAHKPSAGTTDPEEASRILLRNDGWPASRGRERRGASATGGASRLAKEEMARRKAEERAKREEEAQRQAEERRRKRGGEEGRGRETPEREEEAERLQKQKEEEESRQREEAERLRQEREKHFQKRRLNAWREKRKSFLTGMEIMEENGEFEEVIVLPSHSRLSPPEGEEEQHQQQEEERVPVVAFRENGLLKPLSGMEDISAQQGPGQQAPSHFHRWCFSLSSFTAPQSSSLYTVDKVTENVSRSDWSSYIPESDNVDTSTSRRCYRTDWL
ncbi:hypothetical protein INR49_004056 [Caranx melampygus]|nr:hypothetical protein INR49_004056 [Caranx melampygus]